jgi:hypothetical protein
MRLNNSSIAAAYGTAREIANALLVGLDADHAVVGE